MDIEKLIYNIIFLLQATVRGSPQAAHSVLHIGPCFDNWEEICNYLKHQNCVFRFINTTNFLNSITIYHFKYMPIFSNKLQVIYIFILRYQHLYHYIYNILIYRKILQNIKIDSWSIYN